MELSKRLHMVASMVEKGSVAADVGCDHGYVSIWLVQKGICPHVLAMDVNQGPLARAREHVEETGLASYIDLRLSDGLEGMHEAEADTLLAAGIGGRLAARILREGAEKLSEMKQVILQPQSEPWLVRRALEELGYTITDENMVREEGKFYAAVKAANVRFLPQMKKKAAAEAKKKPEGMALTEAQWRHLSECYGSLLIKRAHPVLIAYLEAILRKHAWIREKMERDISCGRTAARMDALREEDASLDAALDWMRSVQARREDSYGYNKNNGKWDGKRVYDSADL